MEPFTTKEELVTWIHEEIASNGTESRFIGKGLDLETGYYNAEEIADMIISGKMKVNGVIYKA